MTFTVIRGDARNLPLPDDSVDLVVTSPPYFGLRSYQDGGEHYAGQVGSEATPTEFVDALVACTAEWMRALKPSGSLWVNLGDKYAGSAPGRRDAETRNAWHEKVGLASKPYAAHDGGGGIDGWRDQTNMRPKSLIGIPWRYALRCIDDLGLLLRAEVIWSKPNGLPESVTDRVRRSHEQWFHLVQQPRYFSAVDEIREAHETNRAGVLTWEQRRDRDDKAARYSDQNGHGGTAGMARSALGKLPGSVWTVPTEPLKVPEHLGVDHFAAFPTEFPKRIIAGWSPSGVCTACGEGRRPVVDYTPEYAAHRGPGTDWNRTLRSQGGGYDGSGNRRVGGAGPMTASRLVTGYTCACPEPTADTRPSVILDPFGGTGTTAHVAHALGRHGITVDLSADYCRIAADPQVLDGRVRKVLGVAKAPPQVDGQADLFGEASA